MLARVLATVFVLAAATGSARAQDSMSLNGFRHHALPVLVRVDAQGRVAKVQSSVALSPRTDRLLRMNLAQMITQPAMQGGKGVSSQMVVQLALVKSPREDGRFAARFEYVSSMPVPAGNWYWVHIDGHRLALAQDDARGHRRFLPTWPGNIVPFQPLPVMPAPASASPAGPAFSAPRMPMAAYPRSRK